MEPEEKYLIYLEDLRKSGVTNMWGAADFLHKEFEEELNEIKAGEILIYWMKNYSSLDQKYGWQSPRIAPTFES